MPGPARIDECDPYGDDGRLRSIFEWCVIGGQRLRALALFEAGFTPDEVFEMLAQDAGLRPREAAPFPSLLHNPFPGPSD